MIQQTYGAVESNASTIRMATGRIVEVDTVATHADPNLVYIRVLGLSLDETFRIFTDKNETARMEYGSFTITGYSGFDYILDEHNGKIKVCLREE